MFIFENRYFSFNKSTNIWFICPTTTTVVLDHFFGKIIPSYGVMFLTCFIYKYVDDIIQACANVWNNTNNLKNAETRELIENYRYFLTMIFF